MELQPGQALSHYRLIEPIGAGGMGVVWKATDVRLNRPVALKFLPRGFVRDEARLQRFQREARLLASLSHGNIATIHELEQADDVPYLVMEFVDGESLGTRLASGPLPIESALMLGRQVAGALAAAHDKSIIHRDLKPDNVMLTADGFAKLLDFGLAKHFERTPVRISSDVETANGAGTVAGSIVGTLGYMSPEQARGETVDGGADLWALGCLLYEMLSGRRAFAGGSTAEILAAILEHEPDWTALPTGTPAGVRRLLGRCLQKDPGKRMRDAAEARREIDQALAGLHGGLRRRSAVPWIALLTAGGVVVAAFLFANRERRPIAPSLPALEQVTFVPGVERFPAWSPRGDRIAYCREQNGIRKIFVHNLSDGREDQVTHGSSDDIQPSWHPDGKALLFVRAREPDHKLQPGDVFGQYSGGDVWRLDLASGDETRLAEKAFYPSYSPNGRRIAVDASWVAARRIWLLDEQGRNPVQLTAQASEGVAHIRPRWSFDGSSIVFQSIQRTTFDVALVEVESGRIHALTDDYFRDYQPVFSPQGDFVYFSSYRSGGINIWRIPLGPDGQPDGRPEQVTTGAGQDVDLAMSANGRLAFSILNLNADIWSLPVGPDGRPVGDPREVLATTREDSRGAWSPDGKLLAFNSDRTGDMNIWVHDPVDGSSHQLTTGPGGDYQPNWSPDGGTLVFFSSREGNADIWTVDASSGELFRLTDDAAYDVNPVFSPDGSRIAFQSDRGGRLEVWIMNADGSSQTAVTSVGVSGHFLRWSDDNDFVFFRCTCGGQSRVMRVPADGAEPQELPRVAGGAHISFSPDRSRILDVSGHQVLWVSPLDGGDPEIVFRFEDPGVRIDYPNWSPDGSTVVFDRFRPEGGDIWATTTAD